MSATNLISPVAALVFCFLSVSVAWAQEIPSYADIAANRDALIEWLATNRTGAEFYTESAPSEDGADTSIALIVEGIDLDEANVKLSGPAAWCEILFLHLNVKGCIYGASRDSQWVKMYMGKKSYQKPKSAEEIELVFNSGVTDDKVSWVTLTADKGPYKTSDYYVGLFAIKAKNGTYAQLRSSQKIGGTAMAAMDLYFDTLARNKVGFSIVGTQSNGKPKYATGTQAALERNVVRYLLALQVYMQTSTKTGSDGMRTRAALWFDATEQYPEQLHEIDRDKYLRNKDKEYRNQVEMQSAIADR